MFQSELSTAEENGQRPLTMNPPGARRDRRGDQRIGIGVPHFVLSLRLVVAEDPVMAGDVGHAPRRRRTAAGELRRDVDDCDEVELHAAERLRLKEAEQPGFVQQLLGFAHQHARVLGRLRALAQNRHDLPRPAHRLDAPDGGEIAPHRLRQRAHRFVVIARGGDRAHGRTSALPAL
jgi:hypothetical protein